MIKKLSIKFDPFTYRKELKRFNLLLNSKISIFQVVVGKK